MGCTNEKAKTQHKGVEQQRKGNLENGNTLPQNDNVAVVKQQEPVKENVEHPLQEIVPQNPPPVKIQEQNLNPVEEVEQKQVQQREIQKSKVEQAPVDNLIQENLQIPSQPVAQLIQQLKQENHEALIEQTQHISENHGIDNHKEEAVTIITSNTQEPDLRALLLELNQQLEQEAYPIPQAMIKIPDIRVRIN